MNKRIKKIILTEMQIDSKLASVAHDINNYYKDKEHPVMLGLLNGCVIFYGQLLTKLTFPLETDFLRELKKEDGSIDLSFSITPEQIKGRNILVVEDILDTGKTLSLLTEKLNIFGAKNIKTVVLVDKTSRRKTPFLADWVVYSTDTKDWIAGYGTDFTNEFVHLQYLVALNKPNE